MAAFHQELLLTVTTQELILRTKRRSIQTKPSSLFHNEGPRYMIGSSVMTELKVLEKISQVLHYFGIFSQH